MRGSHFSLDTHCFVLVFSVSTKVITPQKPFLYLKEQSREYRSHLRFKHSILQLAGDIIINRIQFVRPVEGNPTYAAIFFKNNFFTYTVLKFLL